MSTIVKDLPHPTNLLALFNQVDGILTDAFKVRFQVWDASASLPGTQKLPIAGGWVDASASPYKIRTGTYAVIDPLTLVAWIPTATAKRLQIFWEVTQADGDSTEYVVSTHEVVDSSVTPLGKASMALIQDVKDYGLGATYTDRQIFEGLRIAMAIVDRYCRQRFRLTHERKAISGTGAQALFLPEPLFGLESITINESGQAQPTTSLRVIGATGQDRFNPQLRAAGARARDIYSVYPSSTNFNHRLTQAIVGVWGFVDTDTQQAPLAVRDALVRLTYLQLSRSAASGGSGGASVPAGLLRSEMTDGHMVSYGGSASLRSGSLALLQQDAQVRDALDLYRGPIGIGAPANDW